MKYDQDELYLIVDFLEEELDRIKGMDCWGLDLEEQEALSVREHMFELTISTIATLIKGE
ncbi:hypothetical protein [Pseudomonas phage vB_PsaM_M1]|nr:hypothetical protein [Pseudomonas phage vB_PsaM_M1]